MECFGLLFPLPHFKLNIFPIFSHYLHHSSYILPPVCFLVGWLCKYCWMDLIKVGWIRKKHLNKGADPGILI